MLTVLLDTNILHQETLSSSRMRRFERLIKNSCCKLIVPEIVLEEFRTKRISIINDEFDKIYLSSEKLKKKKLVNENDIWFIHQRALKKSIDSVSQEIDLWVKSNNIDIYKISNTSIDSLFSDYFEGRGAFGKSKCREDIPDAVIYDSIVNIAGKSELYVIIKDSFLKNAVEQIDNVVCLSTLEEFLHIDIIKKEEVRLDEQDSRNNNLLEYLVSNDCSDKIGSYFDKNGIPGIDYAFSSEYLEFNSDYDEVDFRSPCVSVVDQSEDQFLFFKKSHYLGNDKFSISFHFTCEANLKFICDDECFEHLPFKARKRFFIEQSEGADYLNVSGVIDADFYGTITISNLEKDITQDKLKIHLEYLGTDECQLSCALDIETVEILDIY